MNKFFFLTGHFIKKRIFSKAFLITNIILFLVAFLILIIPQQIQKSKPKNDPFSSEVTISVYYGKTVPYEIGEKITSYLNDQLKITKPDKDKKNLLKLNATYLEQKINSLNYPEYAMKNNLEIGAFFKFDGANISVDYYSNFYNDALDTKLKQIIKNINHELKGSTDVEINNTNSFEGPALKDKIYRKKIMPVFLAIYMGLMIMMITTTFQISGTDVINEKNARIVEQIMMNVSSGKHFYSKVIGGLIFSIIQLLLGFIYMLIAVAAVRITALPQIPATISEYSLFGPISIALAFTLLATIIGGVIATTLAGLANSQEEYSQISFPFMMILTVCFYLGIFFTQLSAAYTYIIKAFSYIPIISLFIAPASYIAGSINILSVIISLLGNILFIEIFSILVFPQYKDSLLNYDSKEKLFKRLFTNIKEKRSKK